MNDKTVFLLNLIFITINHMFAAPSGQGIVKNSNESMLNEKITSEVTFIDRNSSFASGTTTSIKSMIAEQNRTKLNAEKILLQATSPSSKSTLKTRKNKNDLYFCCTEDTVETSTASIRAMRDRTNHQLERNTKPPSILKRGKDPKIVEPTFERRPALLLRFFPDGTAVLISKFQLHLHVKPKQIKFHPDEEGDDSKEYHQGLILNNGNSFEVTYKRLESIPASKEQNTFDLNYSRESEAYNGNLEKNDQEFVTTSSNSNLPTKQTATDRKLFPIQESTTLASTTETMMGVVDDKNLNNKEILAPGIGDSPFFIMTSEEMSSLQQQYDPAKAFPLKAITTISPVQHSSALTTEQIKSTQMPPTTTGTTAKIITSTVAYTTPTATTKCVSFKNQLSLALSTEDNIDNSLLKRNILPTEDCNSSITETPKSLETLQITELASSTVPTTLPIITRAKPEPTTTQSYNRNNLVPYLASQFSNHPSKPDVVVVTSLPVLIDLKSNKKQPVTDVPEWREVTVGVVRDQKGQPVKPRYNNWTAHLRGLRKKTENKFWNELTTPKPNYGQQSRQTIQQGIQQSSSQMNRAFWTELQKQKQISDHRNKGTLNAELYRANPPRNYRSQSEYELQFWRNRVPNLEERWNTNNNSHKSGYGRISGPLRNPHRRFEDKEIHQNQQRGFGSVQHTHRRW